VIASAAVRGQRPGPASPRGRRGPTPAPALAAGVEGVETEPRPRRDCGDAAHVEPEAAPEPARNGPRAVCPHARILAPRPGSSDAGARVFGLDAVERLRRTLVDAGVQDVDVLSPRDRVPSGTPGSCVVVRGDHFYDERLVRALLEDGEDLLLAERPPPAGRADWVAARVSGPRLPAAVDLLRRAESEGAAERPTDVQSATPVDLVPRYDPVLRKQHPPFLFPARRHAVREAENRMFAAAYKGLTDLVTKWVWPLPAREVTRLLARRGVSPNAVTSVSWMLAVVTTVLFASGSFASGLACGWLLTFLDTVDGKLARCTLRSSRFGHLFDHSLDLLHPPVWWVAFGLGLGSAAFAVEWATALIVGSYVLGRLLEGVFLLVFRMEIFLWRPFDGFFRIVIARRNPNLLLLSLGVAAGAPGTAFWAVAVWGLVSNAVHAVRLAQALARRRRGAPVEAWYEARSAA